MNRFLKIYFISSLFIGLSVYIAQRNKCLLPDVIQFYLNDFLIIPIVLTISLYILRWSKNNKNYHIPLSIVLYSCFMYSFLFECFLPKFHLRYTSDFIDVILYFASGIIFYILQKNNYEIFKKTKY